MGLEQEINYQLNRYPKIKKVIKNLYQHIMYAVSPKVKSEGNITRVSPDDAEHEYFFGYYDKSPWDISDRYMLCIKAQNTWSDVSPREKADILIIDTEADMNDPKRVIKVGETRAWNVQQACMLQWLGPDYQSRIIYNDYREGKYCSVILNLKTKQERVIWAPVYTVSSDGKFALTLDFSRLYNLRPGYGYYNVPEHTQGVNLPDTPAIWKVDLKTGKVMELFKYTDFAYYQPRPEMKSQRAVHKVNHLMLNPSNNRFMVLYRWFIGTRKYTRLITCNVDGSDMFVLSDDDMVSHCFWKNDKQIIAFENKKEEGVGYYLMDDMTKHYYHCWPEMKDDGHPSFSPNGKLIVTDTYPNRERISCLKIMDGDVRKGNIDIVAKVFSPFKYDNNTRCDLHPRWNHASNKICFDAVFEGHRGVYVVDLKKNDNCSNINEISKIKVLYIVDSLRQRFGVTAVVMNYFRFVEKEKLQIDFLVFEDSEKSIVDEIQRSGSKVYFMPKLTIKNIKQCLDFYRGFFKDHKEYKVLHSHLNQIDAIIFPIAKKSGVKHCISHSHNTRYSDYKVKAIRNKIMCLPIKFVSDTWAACGIKAGEFLFGKNFLKSTKHLIINNAIDINKYKYDESIRELRRKEFNVTDEILIGNVGSLKIQKNQEYLLYVFAELLKSVENRVKYKLMIVGDGNLRYHLIKIAKSLGIDKDIIFTGVRNDVNELLQAMDIFVLPSLYEGLPVIGVEAQAAGLPCLFSDKVTREVDICNARFIALADDKKEWIRAIIESGNNKRIDCSKFVEKKGFSIEKEAKKLNSFYLNL